MRRDGLTRCKLQMLRVAAPGGRRYRPALLTGLSLVRYPGYSDQAGADALRARIEAERPELIAAGVHLIVTQLPGGDLLLGDTHEYGDTVSPFGDERLDELVLAEARRLLGAERLEVRERWHGIYPSAPGHPFLIAEPLPGVARGRGRLRGGDDDRAGARAPYARRAHGGGVSGRPGLSGRGALSGRRGLSAAPPRPGAAACWLWIVISNASPR